MGNFCPKESGSRRPNQCWYIRHDSKNEKIQKKIGKVNVPEDQLLGGLGLLPQDRLGLTAEALLLAIVP